MCKGVDKSYVLYASNASLDKWEYITPEKLTAELAGIGTISNFHKENGVITFRYASNGKIQAMI